MAKSSSALQQSSSRGPIRNNSSSGQNSISSDLRSDGRKSTYTLGVPTEVPDNIANLVNELLNDKILTFEQYSRLFTIIKKWVEEGHYAVAFLCDPAVDVSEKSELLLSALSYYGSD